jgi:protein-S-isoprenylcysteine O-methyltransferase Ste14
MSPVLPFADYPLRLAPLLAGVACLALGLWFFHRSHVDLGTNWSATLEIRERHRLVSNGVYRSIRHPLYSALLLYGVGHRIHAVVFDLDGTLFDRRETFRRHIELQARRLGDLFGGVGATAFERIVTLEPSSRLTSLAA